MLDRRRSGVLLHVGSLPPDANGLLGAPAHRFVDLIADAGFGVWQTLPLNPPGDGDSPYFSASAHAGDPAFIDRAWAATTPASGPGFDSFLEESREWLMDDALFAALRAEHGALWWQWPAPLRARDAAALGAARHQHAASIEAFVRDQYWFHLQWQGLRTHAARRNVLIFGDMPIYVSHDSAEVWAHQEDFILDAVGRPTAVSGVPPDYFAADGQWWGNPLYDWPALRSRGFASWISRIRTQFKRFDLLRIDHFRGLESYWEIPAAAPNARSGRWQPGPGAALFEAFYEKLGPLSLVAEDLGVITPEVLALRDQCQLPGMLVLQFAFGGGADNPYLPHNHVKRAVVYPGTHDNDTTLGWARTLDDQSRRHVRNYFRCDDVAIPDVLMRAALASVAQLAVIPLQDFLGLGSEGRMNTPGTVEGNWHWRFSWEQVPQNFVSHWRELNRLYGRG